MKATLFPLALLVAVSSFGFSQTFSSGDWSYTLNASNEATIISYSGPGGAVVIPDSLDSYPVKQLGDGWPPMFGVNFIVTSVMIPDSVTSIGDYAFAQCYALTSVTISNGVTAIGGFAFGGCTGLTSVTIPDSVTSIGGYAFSYCTSLTRIDVAAANSIYASIDGAVLNKTTGTLLICPPGRKGVYAIPDSVTSIGDGAFSTCTGLTSVTIPDSVTTIGDFAFGGCTGLTSVTIPDSVTTIGRGAFGGCTGLTSLTIPDSVTSIGDFAFGGCTGLTSVTIGNGVTSVGSGMFSECAGLTSVTIGNGVTSIGSHAFQGCAALTSVTIGNGVTSIEDYAFVRCASLRSVCFRGNRPFNYATLGSWSNIFGRIETPGTVYYAVESTGWGATFCGWPTKAYSLSALKEQRVTLALPSKMVFGSSYPLRAKFNAKGAVAYSVDPADAAEIAGNQLRMLKANTPFTVTAQHAGDWIWAATEVNATGVATKRAQKLAFTVRSTRKVGDTFNLLATVDSPLTISVASSDPSIVRINEDGTATALRKGKVVLTAMQDGDDNYATATPVKKTVTVK